ncbi:MAG: DUF4860 domain-containing protein [Eggerthellaceae bacterium]|nr:DUF4860 domain-containing protein [Eggerthellaceae bacterium]
MNINHAVVSAFERSKSEEKKHSTSRVFTLLLLAVFFLVLMGTLAVGAHIYSAVSKTQSYTDDVHIQTGLLAGAVHASDAAQAVERGEGPEGPALVLVERFEIGTYETRIYKHEGMLYLEYAIAGRPYNPKTATPLFKSNTFDFSFDGKLVTITTDLGASEVALRSEQGGSV